MFNLSSLFIGMMKQDGRHSPEEAIPIVNGEVTEPSSPGVVEPIVSGLFNPLSSLFGHIVGKITREPMSDVKTLFIK